MDTPISENPIKLKYKILAGIFLLLVLSVSYYYIYRSDTYLMAHSKNLQNGSVVEECKKTKAPNDPAGRYECEWGYYEVSYPTHKRIFYFWHLSNEIGSYIRTYFLEGADVSTFKALNKNYAIDKNNLYSHKNGMDEIIRVPNADPNSVSIFNDAYAYAKDSASVFFYNEKLHGANPADFKFVDNKQGYFGSQFSLSNGLIFHGSKVVSAVKDGKILVRTQGKEIPFLCKNQRPDSSGGSGDYLCDITESGVDAKIDIDTNSFQVLSNEAYPYAKDKNYVYMCAGIGCSELHVLDGADSKTFNFGEVRGFNEDGNIHDGYILGCKVYEGIKPNYNGGYGGMIQRNNDDSNLCKYIIY